VSPLFWLDEHDANQQCELGRDARLKALDVLVAVEPGRSDTMAHVFITAPDENALSFLKAIAETLRMVPAQ